MVYRELYEHHMIWWNDKIAVGKFILNQLAGDDYHIQSVSTYDDMNLNYKPFFEGQSDNEKNIESHGDS